MFIVIMKVIFPYFVWRLSQKCQILDMVSVRNLEAELQELVSFGKKYQLYDY